jgi:hypothetical protein
MGIYVVLPSVTKASVVFNYVTWFSILYIIAAYIWLYPKDWFNNQRVVGLLAGISLLLSWVSVIFLAFMSRQIGKSISIAYFFVSDSNKILALTTGISGFLFFKRLKMGYSKTINTIAASTFGVLMIHANSNTMRQWLWHDVFNNVGTYETGNVVVHAIVCVVAIYTICTVTDIVRIRFIEKPMLNKL